MPFTMNQENPMTTAITRLLPDPKFRITLVVVGLRLNA